MYASPPCEIYVTQEDATDDIEAASTNVSLLPDDEFESLEYRRTVLLLSPDVFVINGLYWLIEDGDIKFKSINDSDGELNNESAVTIVSLSESINKKKNH